MRKTHTMGGTRRVHEVTNRPMSRVEAEVLRLRALLEKGQFAAALADAETLRNQVPENRDVWYVIAVSQRYLQRIPDALTTLARLRAIASELQPAVSGTRPLLRRAEGGRARHRGVSAGGKHQSGAACELERPEGPVQHDRAHSRCRLRRPARRQARNPARGSDHAPRVCFPTAKSSPPSSSSASSC